MTTQAHALDLLSDSPLAAYFARYGFLLETTGGNGTAFVRKLGDGHEIWIVCACDAVIPEAVDEEIVAGRWRPDGSQESFEHEWRGTAGEYLALLDAIETVLGSDGMRSRLTVGTRVRLRKEIERFPHFMAPAGLTGRVVYHEHGEIDVEMDAPLPGAEEWDNQIVWREDDYHYECLAAFDMDLARDIEILGGAS